MFDFVVPKRLSVSFSDDQNHPLDPTPFDPAAFEDMRQNGAFLSKWALILDAAIHYQGKHRTSTPLRVLNAALELAPSMSHTWDGGFVCFGGDESSEFQTGSTEVIGVGLAVGVATRLFGVRRNQVYVIEGTGKRLDFWIQKGSDRYLVEARGRKGDLQDAIRGVYSKKSAQESAQPRYGVVCHVPRNGSPATALVVDPTNDPEPTPDYVRARLVLEHYARVAALAGFWRLSAQLFHRATLIVSNLSLEEAQGASIEYKNVRKLGRRMSFSLGDAGTWDVFVNADPSVGFRLSVDGHMMFIGLDRHLVDLLELQDIHDLVDYHENVSSDKPIENDLGYFLPRDDGTLGVLLRPDVVLPAI